MDEQMIRYYDFLLDLGIHEDVLSFALSTDGINKGTFNKISYWAFGVGDIEDYYREVMDEDDESEEE